MITTTKAVLISESRQPVKYTRTVTISGVSYIEISPDKINWYRLRLPR